MEKQQYEEREDRRFGPRYKAVVVATTIPPVAICSGLYLWFPWEPATSFIIWVPLVIPLATIAFGFRWTKCLQCDKWIRINWRERGYLGGGPLRYQCDNCRIIWNTQLRGV